MCFDRIADRYDASRGSHGWPDVAAGAIAPWLSGGGPVVEVGVGTGLIASRLAARGCNVVGFDVSLRMLEQARRRLGPRVAVGDAHRLPARAGVAAAVIYVHVLHLVADIPATLAEARRVLTPGGQVVAICTARGEPADDADRLLESLRQLLTGPRADAPDRLAEAACRAGLAVVHEQQLRHDVPSAPADYARSLQERLWSWTWDIDDGTWAQLVAPVISELRSMPHADQARSPSHSRSLFVLAAA